MKKALFFLFQLICFTSYCQYGFTKVARVAWLSGEWEGTGYSKSNPTRQDFRLNFNKTNFILKIESSQDQILLDQKWELESEYSHVEDSGNIITVYFFGEMKWDTVELKINRTGEDNLNLSLVYNRRDIKSKLIMNGAFQRKK